MEDKKSEEIDSDIIRIAILIDELKHEDLAIRLNSIRNVELIAATLGATRTKEELIPFFKDFIDDEDEVLSALAEQIGKLTEYIGGYEYSYVLLPVLELFSTIEENTIRDKIIDSFIKIINALSNHSINMYIIPLIKRLSINSYFTPRLTSLGLYSPVYSRLKAESDAFVDSLFSMRQMFYSLCSDVTPMVRRAAVVQLVNLIPLLTPSMILNEFISVFHTLSHDSQDSVRLLMMNVCISLNKVLEENDIIRHIVPAIKAFCTDSSWRVRYVAAEKLPIFASVRANILKQEELSDLFVKLLSDSEPEGMKLSINDNSLLVRTAASYRIVDVSKYITSSTLINNFIPSFQNLVDDSCHYTKASFASVIVGVSNFLSKQDAYTHLLPLFLVLLKDKNPEVRLNIISKLDNLNQMVDIDHLIQSLLPAIIELAKDPKWRVRKALIGHIPLLATILGMDFFNQHLAEICVSWLNDEVYDVRETTIEILTELSQSFGIAWSKKYLLNSLNKLFFNNTYLLRLTALHFLKSFCSKLDPSIMTEFLFPPLMQLHKDSVPNIRFNVAKVLLNLKDSIITAGSTSSALNILNTLANDNDLDVTYYAKIALNAFSSPNTKYPHS